MGVALAGLHPGRTPRRSPGGLPFQPFPGARSRSMNAPARTPRLELPLNRRADITAYDARAGDRCDAQDERQAATSPGRPTAPRHEGAGCRLLALADPAGSTSAGGCTPSPGRDGEVRHDRRGEAPPALRSSTWISSRRSASKTTRRAPSRSTSVANVLRRLRRPAFTTPTSTRKRPRTVTTSILEIANSLAPGMPLFQPRVHPRDGPLAGGRQRQEARSLIQTAFFEEGCPIFARPSSRSSPALAR